MSEVISRVLNRVSDEEFIGDHYRQRSPRGTTFYQLVSENYPSFLSDLKISSDENRKTKLPDHIQPEFDAYLKCG